MSVRAYNPLSAKQKLSLVESHARINIWEGAVRSGKTHVSLWRFIEELIHGPHGDYAVISRTFDSFKRNILPLLTSMIGADARYYAGKREMSIWGKTCHIIGADDQRAEHKVRGSTFMGSYVDEATIIPESVFKMLVSRCAMKGAKIFATTNPDSPFHWLKRDYLDGNPDVKSWAFRLEDNPELTPQEREYLRRQYKGLWYQRFIEGRWVQAEGSIYDFFDESLHCIDFPQSTAKEYFVGVDYGTTNPCAFVLVGYNPDRYPNLWVEKEYYFDSRKAQRQKTDLEYASDLINFTNGYSVRSIYVDPSAASFKLELLRNGVQGVVDAENEVNDGIRLLSQFLTQGTLKITRGCRNLIQEFCSYVWDNKSLTLGVDKPLKENDHLLDALRYCIYTHFFKRTGASLTARDLERYYQEAMGLKPDLPSFFQQAENFSRPIF